jgi:hypothetical protein
MALHVCDHQTRVNPGPGGTKKVIPCEEDAVLFYVILDLTDIPILTCRCIKHSIDNPTTTAGRVDREVYEVALVMCS